MKLIFKVVLIIFISFTLFCCSGTKTTKTTKVINQPSSFTEKDLDSRNDTEQVITETTEVTEDSSSCGGVLSCTVDVLGEVIALPFRVVGFVVDVIF